MNELVVTITSWKERLNNLPKVFDSIFKLTKRPDKIVLNLSIEEFPHKEKELPKQLLEYIQIHKIIELNWIDGPNTRVWKKILPTFKLYPDACIICIDDDRLYDNRFIEKLWNKHLKYPNNPISCAMTLINGIPQHCGTGTLDKLEYYGDVLNIIEEHPEIIENVKSSDTFFWYMSLYNGTPCIKLEKGFLLRKKYNEVKPYATNKEDIKYCVQYLNSLFGTNYKCELSTDKS